MNVITKLNIRQKIMLTLTILATIFLAWQIYNFVHKEAIPAAAPASLSMSAAQNAAATASSPSKVIRELPPVGQANPGLAVQQREYLELVRQYQITKMKRQILEEQAGVANAQKRIVDSGKGRGYVPDSFTSDGVVGGGYQLSYVDRQAGRWTATINENGQYHEVQVGSHLADGSRVISINNEKVVLSRKQGKNWTITFPGNANVDDSVSMTDKSEKISAKAQVQSAQVQSPAPRPKITTAAQQPSKPAQSNAKIAKMLGITAVPALNDSTPAASVTPVTPPQVETPAATDVPAAPMISTPESKPEVSTQAPVASSEAPVTTANPEANQTESAATSEVVPAKPVSVKELREHNSQSPAVPAPVALETSDDSNQKASEINQISWQQAADLQAAVMNTR